jgi:transcriptional regulator with XRE-family HTH domain
MRPSPTPQVALGRAIGLRRREIGLTQEALAAATGLDETTIRGIEGGKANPTLHVVDRIARSLGWPLWRLAKLADELETKDRRPTDTPLEGRRSRPATSPRLADQLPDRHSKSA